MFRVTNEDLQPFSEGVAHELSNSLREYSAQDGWLFRACLVESLVFSNLAKRTAFVHTLQPYGKDSDYLLLRPSINGDAFQVATPI